MDDKHKFHIAGTRILMDPGKDLELCRKCNQRYYEYERILHERGECVGRRFYSQGNQVFDAESNGLKQVMCIARSNHAASTIARALNARAVYLPRLRAAKRRKAKQIEAGEMPQGYTSPEE